MKWLISIMQKIQTTPGYFNTRVKEIPCRTQFSDLPISA